MLRFYLNHKSKGGDDETTTLVPFLLTPNNTLTLMIITGFHVQHLNVWIRRASLLFSPYFWTINIVVMLLMFVS